MRLFGKLVTDLNESDLLSLRENKISENQILEFKRDLYTKSDRDKREFLKDVVGMANASGGIILIGIEEKDDVAVSLVGVEPKYLVESMQSYSNLILTCIEPRLVGCQIKPITIDDGSRHVVAIGIPQSFGRPHRYVWEKSKRFTVRHNRDTSDMTYDELRRSFLDEDSVGRRVRSFQQTGCQDVQLQIERGSPLMRLGGFLVVHIVPLYNSGVTLDVNQARQMHVEFSSIGNRATVGPRPSFEGIDVGAPGANNDTEWGWLQLFRDGRIQASAGDYVYDRNNPRGLSVARVDTVRCIRIKTLQGDLIDALPRFILGLGILNFPPPYAVAISLLKAWGSRISSDTGSGSEYVRHDTLQFEPFIVEAASLSGNWHTLLQPTLDQLWNAYGAVKCPNFDAEGGWVGWQQ